MTLIFAGAAPTVVQAASSPTVSTTTNVIIPEPPISSIDPSQWGAGLLLDQGSLFEGLAGYNKQNQAVPAIASHWTVTDGGRVWTFYLRHDAKWSNGQPVTAEDFYYAWMRMASPQDSTAALWAGVMQYVENAWTYKAGGCKASQVGLKVVNPYELQVTLSAPHNIIGELPIAGSMPLYPPDVEAHPSDWFMPQYFVGDGPYVVKSFIPNGDITLTRNHDYVGSVGNVQNITIVPDSTVPVEDYMSNKFDVAPVTSTSDYQYIMTHPQLKAQLHSSPEASVTYLEWDKSPFASPLDNVLVRQAIAMAIDRAPIVNNVMDGMVGPATTMGYPGWPTSPYEHSLPYNVVQAQKLLAKAGYPDGKGIPTLYLYSQTQAVNAQSVSTAEAIQEELKQTLNINFQIEPLATTLYTEVTWDGIVHGIKPGYNIGSGGADWADPSTLELQSDTYLTEPGTLGPQSYRMHAYDNWYTPTYDPTEVALWGNPANPKEGLTFAEMAPIQRSVESDIAYLNSWLAKQPAAYRSLLTQPGSQTDQQQWNAYVAAWKAATTPTAKHAAWVSAWEFAGNYSGADGSANVGLQGQVYEDKHQSKDVYLINMWNTESEAANPQQGIRLAADITNTLMNEGYVVPLYYTKVFYLEKPWLHGAQVDMWAWSNFYQMQNLNIQ